VTERHLTQKYPVRKDEYRTNTGRIPDDYRDTCRPSRRCPRCRPRHGHRLRWHSSVWRLTVRRAGPGIAAGTRRRHRAAPSRTRSTSARSPRLCDRRRLSRPARSEPTVRCAAHRGRPCLRRKRAVSLLPCNIRAQTHALRAELHKIGDCPDVPEGHFIVLYAPGWRPWGLTAKRLQGVRCANGTLRAFVGAQGRRRARLNEISSAAICPTHLASVSGCMECAARGSAPELASLR
jgi:hypothetical protein